MFTDDWKKKTTGKAITKKEILTNNQDKKDNSMKHLKGQQFLFTKTCMESEVPPENPESRIKHKPFKA